MPDQLAEFLDPIVANALRKWAQGKGGTIQLPSQRWQSSGHTGAVLTAIFLELPKGRGERAVRKQIVKVLPAGMELEAGRHEAAWQSNTPFAKKHFVSQAYSYYPVGDGRYLMFQEIAGDLVDYQPLATLPPEDRPDVCAAAAQLVLASWNGEDWPMRPPISRAIVADYLRWELRTPIGEIEDWAANCGLAAPRQEWIDSYGERLPNPIGMVLTGLSTRRVVVDYVWGLSHGDFHQGNILTPHVKPSQGGSAGPRNSDEIRIVDLAGFDPAAPLTRDLVALSLSIAASEFPAANRDGQAEVLLRTLLDGGTKNSQPTSRVTAALDAVLNTTSIVPGSLRGEWQAQYLLSLLAGALAHTTYENVGASGQRWFFEVAARAAAEFVQLAQRTAMIPPEPESAEQPDQILIAIVFSSRDLEAAVRLRDLLIAYASEVMPWTVYLMRHREDNGASSQIQLRCPDVLMHLLTFDGVVDVRCQREVTTAISGRVPVIAVRTDARVTPMDYQQHASLIDLSLEDEDGFPELTRRVAEFASSEVVKRRIEADLKQASEEEKRAEGAQRRRLEFFNRELRVRLEDERRRAGPVPSAGRPAPQDLARTTLSARSVRLINEAPNVPAAKFHDRVTEMHQVEEAISDVAVRLIVVSGAVGAGKTAFAAELRRRLAFGKATAVANAVVYLSADGYRPITVATVLADLIRCVQSDYERRQLDLRLTDPVEWPEKLTEVLTALGQTRVVVILDAAEHLLNRDGDFRDQDLHRLLRRLISLSRHVTTLVVTTAEAPPRQLRGESDPPVRSVTLNRGLPFDDAMNFLIALDRTAALGVTEMSYGDRHRLQALSLGHPRTLELFVGVLHQEPARTAANLLDELETVGVDRADTLLFDRMFARLDRTEQRVVQALATYARPVTPEAVDHLLLPFVPGVSSDPVLRGLHDRRIVRHDRSHYFLPSAESQRVLDGIPFGELDDHTHRQPPFTRLSLWRRGASFFERQRPDTIADLHDLRSTFSEIDLRIRAWDYYHALFLMKSLDDRYLRAWGQSDALVEWRRDIRGLLRDPEWEAHNRTYLVAALQQREDTDDALRELRAARGDLPWYRSPRNRISLSIEMAKVRFDSGDVTGAAKLFRRYLLLCRFFSGMQYERMAARMNLGICEAKTGRFPQAFRHFTAALDNANGLSDAERSGSVPMLLASHAWALGQIDDISRALDLLQKAWSEASAAMNEIGVGLSRNGEAAVLIDSGRAEDAVVPAEEAARIAARTRDPGLTRQANLNLGLAQLCLGRLDEAFATAEVSARLDRGPRAIGACGLLGIAAFRLAKPEKARNAFLTAHRVAGEQVKREERDYQAWDALGLACLGMAIIDFEQRGYFLKEAGNAFATARNITAATGAIKRNLVLLDCFGSDLEFISMMRRVASGEPSPFG
ncbi:NACHT domain-containing protein [Micromonospora sp. DT231]|uniref:NACHT domain-containing protein n=1 Tax=Micromonospora sp. DT231 TaxID=3416526 RepID=UPI003CE6AE8C